MPDRHRGGKKRARERELFSHSQPPRKARGCADWRQHTYTVGWATACPLSMTAGPRSRRASERDPFGDVKKQPRTVKTQTRN